MMGGWWAVFWTVLWKGSIVLAMAGAAAALLRKVSASLRHAMWVTAMCVVLLLAVVAALPQYFAAPGLTTDALVIRIAAGPRIGPSPAATGTDLGWTLWLGVSAILLVRLAAAHLKVYRMTRPARRIEILPGGIEVLEGDPAGMPACWGFSRPVIFLPPEASRWDAGLRQTVLEHEAAHIARGDCWWQLFAHAAASLLWFQPLLWWAVWRIREESEHAADDAVLRHGACAADYAGHLIRLARSLRTTPAAAVAVITASRLESRVKALLNRGASRAGLGRASALALVLAAFVVFLPLGAARNADEKVYRIGGGVQPPSVIHKVEPKMTPEARDAKFEGSVLLSIEVDTQGVPRNIKVIRGSKYGLTESAIEAVKQWRFKPGSKNGRPVRVRALIEVNFRLV
ncbi:MAG: M56 family metallopeptidase [Acidobacteriales bacterium]|nr:M56 family metallopeptidase [Terriglobales bacterium]